MAKVRLRKNNITKRKLRVRKKITGTEEMPRLSVFRSNKYIYAQLMDDTKGKTLLSVGKKVKELHKGKAKTEAAFEIGKQLAEEATKMKIEKAIFDRSGYKYHGRVKSLAEGAREGGLKL